MEGDPRSSWQEESTQSQEENDNRIPEERAMLKM